MATIDAGLGDQGKAHEFLEKAYPVGVLELWWSKVDFQIDSLRSDSRFENLLPRVGSANWKSSSGIALDAGGAHGAEGESRII
jgi:hypothetical protein